MSKYGYFVNINNYFACKDCSQGYDQITMLCRWPYYHHIPRKILHNKAQIIGVKPV